MTIRQYNDIPRYSPDFHAVCDFLIRINAERVITPNYLWAAWVWQFGPYMNEKNIAHMGIAEENGQIVGIAVYQGDMDRVYFCADADYPEAKPQLIDYALRNMGLHGEISFLLPDGDLEYQQTAAQRGFIPTQQRELSARIDIGELAYTLPEGFTIMDCADERFDADKYYEAIWKGFDNTRPRNAREIASMEKREGFDAPHLDLRLRMLVLAPNGDYAAHCGMWHLPGSDYAYVEPVFTLPEYRRMGLGKAAVLEGVRRCGERGASHAYVGSSQQFYFNIGFYPVYNETWWTRKTP